jgi:pyruvate dehydrogenase (quinone)
VQEALAHDGPALVDCDVNADEPPTPGKIEYAQVKGVAQAFLHGQPHRTGIVKTVVEDAVSKLRS